MPKAKEIVQDDGWTRVTGGKPGAVTTPGIPPLSKDATPEKLLADFGKKMRVWQASSCRKEVRNMLDRRRPDDGWSLDTALCLASGSFSRDDWENSKRSMFQFVAFVDMVRYLQQQSSTAMKMYAQEPRYTDVDLEFMKRLEVDALKVDYEAGLPTLGSAKDHFGPQSVVFEFFMDMDIEMWSQLYTTDTPLIIGSPSERRLGGVDKSEWIDLAETYRTDFRSLNFPRFDEDSLVFEALMFHWKEPREDEDADEG